jgi:hypothetical protein
MPFMAGEGMAMDWLGDYSTYKNVYIAINAPRMLAEISFYLALKNNWDETYINERVIYLPNYYPKEYKFKRFDYDKSVIDIGCFGAVRLLKNHLVQAFGSLMFAKKLGKKLRFHVNIGRLEMQGDPVYRNLTCLFTQLYGTGHELVNHTWTPRNQFLELCATMDIGIQTSFTETFNIVGADIISQGVPLVSSLELPWAPGDYCADPTDSEDIANTLKMAYTDPQKNVKDHQALLRIYVDKTEKIWTKYFA